MTNRRSRIRLAGAWALCAAWMALIFIMSAMPGDVSGEQSGAVVTVLLAVHDAVFGPSQPDAEALALLELIVRKCAHMAEYAVLALLLRRALRLSGARRPSVCALALCALYAAGDEFHQSFVGGRGPSPVDVMIDTVGASAALLLRRALAALRRK